MKKGVLFDFNGTLYSDHDINYKTWEQIFKKYAGDKIDFNAYYPQQGYKYSSHQIVTHIHEVINKPITFEEADAIVEEKEVLYRKVCTDLHRNKMINGMEDILNYLKEHKIPIIICTCSIKSNVDFYYENLKLERWFDKKQTVYIDDPKAYLTKKEMYQECARRLNVDIKDCVIFEDSPKAIQEAIDAGCQNLVIQKRDDSPSHPYIKQALKDYSELDYAIFE